VRAIPLILLMLGGCGSDRKVADMSLDMSSPDLAVCTHGVGAAPTVATPCGPLTCAPGQICVEHQPGTAIPDMAYDGGVYDGGYDPLYHSCLSLPPECQACGGCGDGTSGGAGKQFGCFVSICRPDTGFEETGCRFDGAILTCIGL
jgi:hypothetical protein